MGKKMQPFPPSACSSEPKPCSVFFMDKILGDLQSSNYPFINIVQPLLINLP